MKPKAKFLIGLGLYAVLHSLCVWLASPRAFIWIIGLVAFVCFTRALWLTVNRRKLLTGLLITSLLLPGQRLEAQDPEPELLAYACMIVVVGAVVIMGLTIVCKKLPPTGACTCGCGVVNCSCNEQSLLAVGPVPPVSGEIFTNPPSISPPNAQKMPALVYQGYGNPGGSFVDVRGRPWTYVDSWALTMESSTNLLQWEKSYKVSAFSLADGSSLVSISSNGVPIYSTLYTDPRNPANVLPFEFSHGQPKEFWRIACQ